MPPTTSTGASVQPRLGQLTQGSANARLKQLLGPAAKAYMLGYLVEAIPSILKHILRFVNSHVRRLSREAKRLREEREVALERQRAAAKEAGGSRLEELEKQAKAAAAGTRQASWLAIKSVLRDLPTLLSAILGSLSASAVSPTGMAMCSTLTILLWKLLDLSLLNTLEKVLDKQPGSVSTSRSVATCFVAAAFASASSLIILQSGEEASDGAPASEGGSGSALGGTPLDKRSMRRSPSNPALLLKRLRGITNPLAPGGHFLSRLTNLSIPATPQIQPDADGLPSSPLLPATSLKGSTSPAFLAQRPVSPVADMKGSIPRGQQQQQQQQSRSPSIDPPNLSIQIPVPTSEKQSVGSSGETPITKPKPSSTIDFTLFALVRGLDTFVRVFPILLASRSAIGSASSSGAHFSSEKGKAKAENVLRKAAGSVGHLLVNQAEGFIFVVCCGEFGGLMLPYEHTILTMLQYLSHSANHVLMVLLPRTTATHLQQMDHQSRNDGPAITASTPLQTHVKATLLGLSRSADSSKQRPCCIAF